MTKFEWSEEFALGLQEIDGHHRHLFGLLEKTHKEFLEGSADLQSTLQDLAQYAGYHFKSEALWMMNGRYPEMPAHQKEHAFFLAKVADLRRAFDGGRMHLSLELIIFLEEWIAGHILETDATLGRFLLDRERSDAAR